MLRYRNRRGLGKGLGIGYKNLIPIDPFIHSLSAKGVKTRLKCPMARSIPKEIKTPTVEILSDKEFDEMFGDEYNKYEIGYATTKILPNGDTHVYVRDSGDYERNGLLVMHELKELEIWEDLVKNKCINPNLADEMAHNKNPVKIEGVMDKYKLDAST